MCSCDQLIPVFFGGAGAEHFVKGTGVDTEGGPERNGYRSRESDVTWAIYRCTAPGQLVTFLACDAS
jgi:hypothetical protein